MGFMDQFVTPQNSGKIGNLTNPATVINAARQLANNDPRSMLKQMADNGVTCNLPNGKVMGVDQLMAMAEGKTAQQLLDELGLS